MIGAASARVVPASSWTMTCTGLAGVRAAISARAGVSDGVTGESAGAEPAEDNGAAEPARATGSIMARTPRASPTIQRIRKTMLTA